jgi:hypothetical protein
MNIPVLEDEKWVGGANNKDYIFKNIWGGCYFKFRIVDYKISGIEIRTYEKTY